MASTVSLTRIVYLERELPWELDTSTVDNMAVHATLLQLLG